MHLDFFLNRKITKKKICKFLLGERKDSDQLKLYLPAHREFENLGFVSVAPMVCMSCVFVYDVININVISTFIPDCINVYRAQTISWLIS